jgi:hypothetical protein
MEFFLSTDMSFGIYNRDFLYTPYFNSIVDNNIILTDFKTFSKNNYGCINNLKTVVVCNNKQNVEFFKEFSDNLYFASNYIQGYIIADRLVDNNKIVVLGYESLYLYYLKHMRNYITCIYHKEVKEFVSFRPAVVYKPFYKSIYYTSMKEKVVYHKYFVMKDLDIGHNMKQYIKICLNRLLI